RRCKYSCSATGAGFRFHCRSGAGSTPPRIARATHTSRASVSSKSIDSTHPWQRRTDSTALAAQALETLACAASYSGTIDRPGRSSRTRQGKLVTSRSKVVTCSLLFGTQLFSYMIRFAFSVVAPTLMRQYGFSPQTMGYILSGWNWSYTAGLTVAGLMVDRFGPYIVLGIGSLIWGVSTIALPVSAAAVSLFLLR